MKHIMEIDGKIVHIFGYENIDGKAISQFSDAMKQSYVTKGALMADAHVGYCLPIGGVVSCKDVVVPAYIGYDISCGIIAMKLKDVGIDEIRRNADAIFEMIYQLIPVGQNHHKVDQKWNWESIPHSDFLDEMFRTKGGLRQCGTLGGGNHYCEIGWDKDGDKSVWIIIHSGSRNVGHSIGTHYMRIAGDGKVREGHYPLMIGTNDADNYLMDMNFCKEFALESRLQMAEKVFEALNAILGYNVSIFQTIDCNHNHAILKDGEWLHRKGATTSEKDEIGIIAGSMRDGSFIVRGKGNPLSLCSSSHGAGRLYSRTKAKEILSVDDFRKGMYGITAKVGNSTLDESFGAYKDIYMVIENQEELVDIVAHIIPVINIKG